MTDLEPSVLEVPIANSVSKERLADEIALMKYVPLVVGHRSDIPNPGDFIIRGIFDTPVLITRTTNGDVNAFQYGRNEKAIRHLHDTLATDLDQQSTPCSNIQMMSGT